MTEYGVEMSNRCAVSGVFGTGGSMIVLLLEVLVVGNAGASGKGAGGKLKSSLPS